MDLVIITIYFLNLLLVSRNGDTRDLPLLRRAMHMIHELSFYHTDFEQPFLAASEQYYAEEGARLVEELDMSNYLEHVAHRLHEETYVRIEKYFHTSTRRAINAIVEKELFIKHIEFILDKGMFYITIY